MRILPNQRNMALTETCAHRNLFHTEKIFQLLIIKSLNR